MRETGLNSGFMIPQYTAAALVSENKVLCHPASVDSIPTSLGQEDHVSMGSISALKLLRVFENVETVLAIEVLTAAQALDYRLPLRPGRGVEAAHQLVRAAHAAPRGRLPLPRRPRPRHHPHPRPGVAGGGGDGEGVAFMIANVAFPPPASVPDLVPRQPSAFVLPGTGASHRKSIRSNRSQDMENSSIFRAQFPHAERTLSGKTENYGPVGINARFSSSAS